MFERIFRGLRPADPGRPAAGTESPPAGASLAPSGVPVDWSKAHPGWRPGAGFELYENGTSTPISLDNLRAYIAARRVVDGDVEADRLASELAGLLAIERHYEQRQRGAHRGAVDPG